MSGEDASQAMPVSFVMAGVSRPGDVKIKSVHFYMNEVLELSLPLCLFVQKVIFGRSCGPEFVREAYTGVVYHNK